MKLSTTIIAGLLVVLLFILNMIIPGGNQEEEVVAPVESQQEEKSIEVQVVGEPIETLNEIDREGREEDLSEKKVDEIEQKSPIEAEPTVSELKPKNEDEKEPALGSTQVVQSPKPLISKGKRDLPVLLILSSVILLLVFLNFYLYRWRKRVVGDKQIVVPEEFWSEFTTLKKAITQSTGIVASSNETIEYTNNQSEERSKDLMGAFLGLQTAINERDAEIKRLKEGYDNKVFKNFLLRFVRVDLVLSEYLSEEGANKKSLEDVKEILDDALDECDVEIFEPSVGGVLQETEGVADQPKVIVPESPNDEFKIVEVIEPGYRMRLPDDSFEYIKKSKVSVYGKYQENKKNG
jgi:hypothetical protein